MKKRDLKDILREVHREGVKDPESIRQYMCALGNRTLYSLMYGAKQRCSDEERYQCWSHLEFVLLAYTCLSGFTEEEIARCMKHIKFKDFLCLVDHLNDQNMIPTGLGVLRTDFEIENMQEMALGHLLKLLLRAKARGDNDVNNFCMIHFGSMYGVADEDAGQDTSEQKNAVYDNKASVQMHAKADEKKGKNRNIGDFFYVVKDRLNLDGRSWAGLDIGSKETEFGCLRELMVVNMEDFGFREKFSLPEVLVKCKIMCKE